MTSSRHGLAHDVTFAAVFVPDPANPGNFVGTGQWGGQVRTVLINPGQCSSTQLHDVRGTLETATASIGGDLLTYYLFGGERYVEGVVMGNPFGVTRYFATSLPSGKTSLTFQEENPQFSGDDCWGTIAFRRWVQIEFIWFDPHNPPPPPAIPQPQNPPVEPPVIPAPPR